MINHTETNTKYFDQSRADWIEIHGVAESGSMSRNNPAHFSAFVNLKEGGIECISDHAKLSQCRSFSQGIADEYGLPIAQYVEGGDFFPSERVASILACADENCEPAKIGYYPTLLDMVEKVKSSKFWAIGEIFVWADSPADFLILKQIAPDSSEMLVISRKGVHDVLSANMFDAKDLLSTLEGYLK